MPRRISIRNQLVDTLLLEKLARQGNPFELQAVGRGTGGQQEFLYLPNCLLPICPHFYFLRGGAPGPFFLTLGLREPRGSVRFGLAACFLRAARFSFRKMAEQTRSVYHRL